MKYILVVFLSLFLTGCFSEQDYTGFYKNEDGNIQILKLEKINNDGVYLMKEINSGGAPFKVKIKDKTITEMDANTQIGSVKGSDILVRDYDKKEFKKIIMKD